MKEKIKRCVEIIKHNKFINDMNWRIRAEENLECIKYIKKNIDKADFDKKEKKDILLFIS